MSIPISSRDEFRSQVAISSDLISSQSQSEEVKVDQNAVQLSSDRCQIVHATTGRVRIRAIEGGFNSKIETISQCLQQHPGIKEVVVNQQTGSLIVSFDENQLSLPQILGILQQFSIYQPPISPHLDPFAEWKSLDFWKEQSISLIPLITGLVLTGGLGIHGLAAIPIYMITADATRWVIEYLEPEVIPSQTSKDSQPQLPLSKVDITTKLAKIAYSIVHIIPGRIRFHVPQIAEDRGYGRRLETLLKNDPQVTSVRVNDDAASIAIAYQPSDISISHWINLLELALQKNPPINPIKTTEHQADEPIDTTITAEAETQDLSSVVAHMKAPCLSYTLDFMANLPV
ncbi:MAG: HMA2 domain-containing protein [Gloeotrichia echinulata CP02]